MHSVIGRVHATGLFSWSEQLLCDVCCLKQVLLGYSLAFPFYLVMFDNQSGSIYQNRTNLTCSGFIFDPNYDL